MLSTQWATTGIGDPARDDAPSLEDEVELFDFLTLGNAEHSPLHIGWESSGDQEFVRNDADMIAPSNNPGDAIPSLFIRDSFERHPRISGREHSLRKDLDCDTSQWFSIQNDPSRDGRGSLVLRFDLGLNCGTLMQPRKECKEQKCNIKPGHSFLPRLNARVFHPPS